MTDGHAFHAREDAAERYLLGEMSDADRESYEAHFFSCPECATEVRTTAAFLADVREQVAPQAAAAVQPAKVLTFGGWSRSSVVPWAIAASLVVFTAYQSFVLVPSLRPRGMDPITLRPDSRGEEPVVRLPPASNGYSLAIEINDVQEGTVLEYKIATVEGRQVETRRDVAPQFGKPLVIWVPSWILAEPVRYEISIHDVSSGRLLETRRFLRAN